MAGVAEALQAIHHAGVVHRDLKPSNVLLAPDGPRVIDFGIAWAAEATAVTRTGIRVGSPQFMAPEQISGVAVAPAIDVFSLGSLAAFAATGRPPFGEGGMEAVLYRVLHEAADLRGCPPPLRDLVERCLAKQPADRPAVADIVAEARRLAAGQGLQVSQSWLPASVAAALAQHAPPPVPIATIVPTVTAQPPQAGPRPVAAPPFPPQPAAPQSAAPQSFAPQPAAPQSAGPHPGWAAAKAGAFVLPTLHCSGLLLISGTGPGRVTLREVVLKNTRHLCAPGATMTLTRSGPGEMHMTWQDAQNPVNVATGTLTRLGG